MKNIDKIIGAIIILAVAVFFFIQSFFIVQETSSPMGPGFWPRFVCIAIFALGIINLGVEIRVRKLIDKKKNAVYAPCIRLKDSASKYCKREGEKKVSFFNWIKRNRDWASIILMGIYVFSMKYLGFIISSAIYLYLQIILFTFSSNKRSHGLYITISIVGPVFVYYLFTKIFKLLLPTGFLGFI